MATKHKSTPSIITLSEQASQKLHKILSAPATERQKRSFKESVGVYEFYKKKWQKKST